MMGVPLLSVERKHRKETGTGRKGDRRASFVLRAMVSGPWNTNCIFREGTCRYTPRAVREILFCSKTQQPTAANPFSVTKVLRAFTGKEGSVSFWKAQSSPKLICLECKDNPSPTRILVFDNPPLYYNLLNIHLLPFRQRLLKFQYQAIFIIQEYVKQ